MAENVWVKMEKLVWNFLPESAGIFFSKTTLLCRAVQWVKKPFFSKKCIFLPEIAIFSKKSFYSKLISDQNYIICTCQKIHFQIKLWDFIFHQILPSNNIVKSSVILLQYCLYDYSGKVLIQSNHTMMNVYILYCSKLEESLLPEFELFYLFIIILIFHIIFTICKICKIHNWKFFGSLKKDIVRDIYDENRM